MFDVHGRSTIIPADIHEKITKYKAFWERTNTAPLLGFSLGNYFISKRFEAVKELLEEKRTIEAHMFDAEAFKADYLRMHEAWSKIDHDIVFTTTPFPGIPWMEAILGCEVSSTGSSFVAHSTHQAIEELHLQNVIHKAWLRKYLEFTEMLQELGQDKFPVGQPIMRGPTDIVGTILGQTELVYAFYDHPEKITTLLHNAVDRFLEVMREQKKRIQDFYGGYAIGFYDLWCPGDCIWYQDDLNALFSPNLYEQYIYNTHKRLARSAEYTMFHLHPASFYVVDYLLEIEELNAIQINKDVGGPSVEEMLPVFQKVQQEKNLVLWGDFTAQEVELLSHHLRPEGVYIIVFTEDVTIQPKRYRF